MDNADTVVILSSQLISQIVEQYFNSTMFRQSVEIVDLQPTEKGYLFSIVFQDTALTPKTETPRMTQQEEYAALMRQKLMDQGTRENMRKSLDTLTAASGIGPSVQDMLQRLEEGEG